MNTTKREWARQEIARIDAQLLERGERIPSADWRRIRAKAAGQARLRARRDRLARVVGLDFDDGPTPF
jgi:hypothetical protein